MNKPTIMVFNKIDAYQYEEKEEDDLSDFTKDNYTLQDWENTYMAKDNVKCIFISAQEKTNIEELRELFYEEVKKLHIERYPHNNFLY
jgi:GTP-binding protein HflX